MSNNINSENLSDSKANNNKVKNENSSNNSDKKVQNHLMQFFIAKHAKELLY